MEISKNSNLMDSESTQTVNSTQEEGLEVYVYGEWIHRNCQTSDSKEDKYKYKDRGLNPGHLYAFGVGLVMNGNGNNSSDSTKLDSVMEKLANSPANQTDNQHYIIQKCMDINGQPFLIMLLNQTLKTLLNRFGFHVVPIIAETLNIEEGILEYGPRLLPPNIDYEGVIFTGSYLERAIKLKNPSAEGNDPMNIERYKKFHKHVEDNDHSPSHPFIERSKTLLLIMKKFIDYHGNNSYTNQLNSSVTTHFERAYHSAKTKFPSLCDVESTDHKKDPGWKKQFDMYKKALKDEMLQDLSKTTQDSKNIDKSILDPARLDQFINDTLCKEINELNRAITR